MKLKISADLTLPVDVVTETIAILAKRRAGKSYTMRRLVEQIYHAGQQIVLVDPKGDQWGVRSSADGKGPGLPIIILGGERGDVPLESTGGEVVAKLVVQERVSVLLDLSLFRKHELATFMTGFLENLYRLKAQEQYRTPVMLVIDEADAVAPQKPQKGEERMLGAAEDIVRRGGQRGIGCVLVSQRSAVLNKNVLTQAQILVALRTIAPQDLAAMDAWIDVHGTLEQRKTLMESLPSLPVGDAWIWSPGWPTADGIFKRVHVLPIETFDSGATPKAGEKRVEPKKAADVDLEALKKQMSATIERAKADDPKALRAELAKVRTELAKKTPAAAPAATKATGPRREDVATITALRKALEIAMKFIVEINAKGFFDAADGKVDKAAIEKAIAGATQAIATLVERHVDQRNKEFQKLRQQGDVMVKRLQALLEQDVTVSVNVRHNEPFTVTPARVAAAQAPRAGAEPAEGITGPQQRVLDSLAWWESVGVAAPDKGRIGFIADYRVGKNVGGTFGNLLGALRSDGLIEYPRPGNAALTPKGRAIARAPAEQPSTAALQAAIHDRLDGPESRVLQVLIDEYPGDLTKQECGRRADYSVGDNVGGTFGNILGRLRSLGLIDYPTARKVVALPVLFLER